MFKSIGPNQKMTHSARTAKITGYAVIHITLLAAEVRVLFECARRTIDPDTHNASIYGGFITGLLHGVTYKQNVEAQLSLEQVKICQTALKEEWREDHLKATHTRLRAMMDNIYSVMELESKKWGRDVVLQWTS